jgi:hypothetical protein
MLIDGNFIDEDSIVSNSKKFLKQYNNLFISEEQKEILDKYDINVYNYSSISSLIYDIEELLNNSIEELDDLEWVSQTISEYNYYNNTNK